MTSFVRHSSIAGPGRFGPVEGRRRTFVLFLLLPLIFSAASCKKDTGQKDTPQTLLQHQLRARVQTLDPADVGDTVSDGVAREFFDCLYTYHYLKRPLLLIPQLAADMPVVSDDGRVYTFTICDDVYFHDDPCFPNGKGRKLTADDFVFSFKRIADVKSRSKNWWMFDGRIVGLNEFREYSKTCGPGQADYARPVEGLIAPDSLTLQVTLVRPWPQFLFWLAHLPSAPMAPEAVNMYRDDISRHPVGTGPFRFQAWSPGSFIQAERNPNYYAQTYPDEGMPEDLAGGLLADAGKPVPFVDKIIWRIIPEDQPRWLLFMRGRLDIITIPKDNFGQAVAFGRELTDEMKKRDIRMVTFDEPCTFWVGFNMEDPLLASNKDLRYAISCCIDRDKFIEIIFNGRGKSAHGFIPPAMPGYDPNVAQFSHSHYDLQKAREFLNAARIAANGDIPKLRLALGGVDPTYRQIGQFIQQNLAQIGLVVELELYDWPTFLEKLKNKQHQLFFSGWIADYPDVENFLQVFYSKNAPWPNNMNYSSPEFDKIYESVIEMPPSAERTKLYHQTQKVVIDDLPCAFVYHRIGYILHHGWVSGLKANAYKADTNGQGLSKYYRVDAEKRKIYRQRYK